MPNYEYRCIECETVFEIFYRRREAKEDVGCPKCASARHTRLMSAPIIATRGEATSKGPARPRGACGGGACEPGVNNRDLPR